MFASNYKFKIKPDYLNLAAIDNPADIDPWLCASTSSKSGIALY